VIDFISELTLAHHFGFRDAAALTGDDFLHAFAQLHHLIFRRRRVNDENHFVSSCICQN